MKDFRIAFVMYNVLSTERMSLMLLSALTKQHFPYAEVDMFVYLNGHLDEKLTKFQPDIVVYSAMTGEHRYYLEIAKEIKKIGEKIGKKIFQIMGGPHCTFAPQVLKISDLDAIGVGECDDAWIDFLSAMESGRSVDDLLNIITQKNFDRAVKPLPLNSKSLMKCQPINFRPRTCRDPVNHKGCLDHLPFLDWELFLKRTSFEKNNSLLKRTIMTRRGCPFVCTYCFNRTFNTVYTGKNKIVHNYSIDRIIEECKYVETNWPTEFWKIYDDTAFFSSKGEEGERLKEFVEKWPREIGLPFFVLTRADLVARDPDILRLLKKAGCISVTMSIESGNEYVRNKILGRGMSDKDIIFAHHLAWDLGMKTFTNVIFSIPISEEEIRVHNLPPKSIDRDIQSLELSVKSKVHFWGAPMLYPYPGTRLGKYCEEMRFPSIDINEFPSSYQNISPFDCFTPEEKRMSQNLSLLGIWCTYFGSRKNVFIRKIISPLFLALVEKFLIRLPWVWCAKIYFLMWSPIQQWLCGAEIYRPKYRSPWKTFKQGFLARLKYEFASQFPKN